MCTAISYTANDHYFGRNLDLEHAYIEAVTITPRNFPFHFRETAGMPSHYAMIGMAAVVDNYPLYYDATNEYGLSIAALNFPGNAVYNQVQCNHINIASFELIPWLLSQFKTVIEVKNALEKVNIIDTPFNSELPTSPLHWIVSDRRVSIVIEPTANGLLIIDNPINVLTNNPPFQYHLYNLQNYINISANEVTNRFSDSLSLTPYSRGMGSIGLPGDLSSSSRFVKAAFVLQNSVADDNESSQISQFFHILGSVAQQRGCVRLSSGMERTIYSSCCNTNKGIYYYTTYENSQITGINMHNEDLVGKTLISYPLITDQQILWMN